MICTPDLCPAIKLNGVINLTYTTSNPQTAEIGPSGTHPDRLQHLVALEGDIVLGSYFK